MKTLPLLLVALALNASVVFAQTDKPGGGTAPPPRPDAVSTGATMELKDDRPQPKKTIAELSTHHQRLVEYCGSWKEVITTWEGKKSRPRIDSSMMCNIIMTMENHQQATHKGMINGERFAGISTISCDTVTGLYTSTWIDNSSTGMTVMTGKWDPQTNTLVFSGEEIDPESKQKKIVREVHSYSTDDKTRFRIEVYKSFPKEAEFKTMQIDFERAKR